MQARVTAIQELAARRDPATIPLLRALIHDPLPDVSAHAIIALGTLRAVEAVPDLIALVRDQDAEYHCAVASLGEIGSPEALDFLVALLAPGTWDDCVAMALAKRRDSRAAEAVTRYMLDSSNRASGNMAGKILAGFGPLAIEPLLAAAHHPNPVVRRRACLGLFDLVTIHKAPEGSRAVDALRSQHANESDPDMAALLDQMVSFLRRKY